MSKKKIKKPDLDKVRQNIFDAKSEKEKQMWQRVLNKLEGKK